MRFAIAALFAAAALAQTMPPVSGEVVVAASFRYIDVKTGDGAPAAPGQEYTVHYSGWLRDGTRFDSSIGRDPIKFVQGRRAVIAGWEMGFEGMKVGGKRRLFIPYQLAYGELGRDPIPPKAELIFDVELLDVKPAPEAPLAAADLLAPLNEIAEHFLALAKAVPEDKYGWRPGPGVRSFQEVFLHIAYENQTMLNMANGDDKGDSKSEVQPIDKEKTIAALTQSLAAVQEYMQAEQARGLTRDADFFGTKTTRRGVLTFIDTHIAEHLGQLVAYARMNGIVPPWSQ